MRIIPTYHFLDRYSSRILKNNAKNLNEVWKLDFLLARPVFEHEKELFFKLCSTYLEPGYTYYFNPQTRSIFALHFKANNIVTIATCFTARSKFIEVDVRRWYDKTITKSLYDRMNNLCGDVIGV